MLNNKKAVSGLRLIDFCDRLPGPYASREFQKRGYEVIKVEMRPDPFNDGPWPDADPNFSKWYEELNQGKKILNWPESDEEKRALLKGADFVLAPKHLYPRISSYICEGTKSIVLLKASKRPERLYLHDLNIMAHYRLANLNHGLPSLPWAGLFFGEKIVQSLMAAYIQGSKSGNKVIEEIDLESAVGENLALYKTSSGSTLPTGKFPCYNVYRLNSGDFFTIAAPEKKLWDVFIQELKIDKDADAFDLSGRVYRLVEKKVNQLDREKVNALVEKYSFLTLSSQS